MKKWLKDKFTQLSNWLSGTVMPKLKKTSPIVQVLGFTLLAIVVALLIIVVISAIIFIGILLPGMVVGLFAWLAWTYFGLGEIYFSTLNPVYLHIPYWHFAWGFAVLILIWRVIRKKGKVRGDTDARSGNWRLKKSST